MCGVLLWAFVFHKQIVGLFMKIHTFKVKYSSTHTLM